MAYSKYKYRSVAAKEKTHYYPQRRQSLPALSNGYSSWYSPVASKEEGNHLDWNDTHPDGRSTTVASQWDGRTWIASEPVTHLDGAETRKYDDRTMIQSWSDASDDVCEGEQCRAEIRSDSTRSQDTPAPTDGTDSSYPRFATYVRRSSCKHTFIHFSETMYNTRNSVDDSSITYREYAEETFSRRRCLPRSPEERKKNADPTTGPTTGPQTLMICNIPCRFTQQELMAMLNAKGFESTYNFFYLPMDGKRASKPHAVKKASNLGYAFVNFRTPRDAARFQSEFHGFCFVGTLSKKVCKVAPARMQGFYENIRCYQRRITCDDARNSPFIDVPLKRFGMKISKFIEWIFSPTDIEYFLPACKDPSWADDTITCDNILPYSIEDQNELRYRKEEPLVSSQ